MLATNMFSMLTLCIKHLPNILTEINKYYIYIYDDQTLLIFFSSLIFGVIFWLFVTYGIDLVSIPRYYILVSYRSQNYGIEPSLLLCQCLTFHQQIYIFFLFTTFSLVFDSGILPKIYPWWSLTRTGYDRFSLF